MSDPVRIQILSDLHLETPKFRPSYWSFEIQQEAPYLALLGDIGNSKDDGLFDFLEKQLHQFNIVFLILGNHEPYYSNFPEVRDRLQIFEEDIAQRRAERATSYEQQELGLFVLLDRERFDFPGTQVTILGCTLFSHITAPQRESVSRFVNDFSGLGEGQGYIADWTVDDHNKAHSEELLWLNEEVAAIEKEDHNRIIAILTHYSPTLLGEANDPRHTNDVFATRSAFVTDLSVEYCWTSRAVKLWAFGHTHFNCDFVHEVTKPRKLMRILANQRGYSKHENLDFDAGKVIVLGSKEREIVVNQESKSVIKRTQRDLFHTSMTGSKRSPKCTVM